MSNPQNALETLPLLRPLALPDGTVLRSLTLYELSVRDMKQAQRSANGDEAQMEINLFARFCGLVPEDFEALSLADYGRVRERFQHFNSVAAAAPDQAAGGGAGAVVSLSAQ